MASPIIWVFKKDGPNKLIVDYKKLNTFIKKDWYPFPLVMELKDWLNGAIIFIKMDLYNNYHLIKMKESEE